MYENIMIGIISYLPEDEVTRTKRLNAISSQVSWLKDIYPKTLVYVVAQNYRDSDYMDSVTYISKHTAGIGPGPARNELLINFYATDKDWLLLCDDDTTCYDYYSYKDFMRDVAKNPNKFLSQGIDAISCIEPEYYPFKKSNYSDSSVCTQYRFVPRELNSGSALSFISNIKKHKGKEQYFEKVDFLKNEGREDIRFLCSWIKQGLTWYKMNTWIRKSLSFNHSSIFGKDIKNRDMRIMQCLDNEIKYSGIGRKVNGRIDWASFNSKHNKSLKNLLIERDKVITLTDKEKPKERSKKDSAKRRLF